MKRTLRVIANEFPLTAVAGCLALDLAAGSSGIALVLAVSTLAGMLARLAALSFYFAAGRALSLLKFCLILPAACALNETALFPLSSSLVVEDALFLGLIMLSGLIYPSRGQGFSSLCRWILPCVFQGFWWLRAGRQMGPDAFLSFALFAILLDHVRGVAARGGFCLERLLQWLFVAALVSYHKADISLLLAVLSALCTDLLVIGRMDLVGAPGAAGAVDERSRIRTALGFCSLALSLLLVSGLFVRTAPGAAAFLAEETPVWVDAAARRTKQALAYVAAPMIKAAGRFREAWDERHPPAAAPAKERISQPAEDAAKGQPPPIVAKEPGQKPAEAARPQVPGERTTAAANGSVAPESSGEASAMMQSLQDGMRRGQRPVGASSLGQGAVMPSSTTPPEAAFPQREASESSASTGDQNAPGAGSAPVPGKNVDPQAPKLPVAVDKPRVNGSLPSLETMAQMENETQGDGGAPMPTGRPASHDSAMDASELDEAPVLESTGSGVTGSTFDAMDQGGAAMSGRNEPMDTEKPPGPMPRKLPEQTPQISDAEKWLKELLEETPEPESFGAERAQAEGFNEREAQSKAGAGNGVSTDGMPAGDRADSARQAAQPQTQAMEHPPLLKDVFQDAPLLKEPRMSPTASAGASGPDVHDVIREKMLRLPSFDQTMTRPRDRSREPIKPEPPEESRQPRAKSAAEPENKAPETPKIAKPEPPPPLAAAPARVHAKNPGSSLFNPTALLALLLVVVLGSTWLAIRRRGLPGKTQEAQLASRRAAGRLLYEVEQIDSGELPEPLREQVHGVHAQALALRYGIPGGEQVLSLLQARLKELLTALARHRKTASKRH